MITLRFLLRLLDQCFSSIELMVTCLRLDKMEVTTVQVISSTNMKNKLPMPRKLPISILLIFSIFQFFIGYDFGFSDVLIRDRRFLVKCYSRFICFVAFLVFGIPLIFHDSAKFSYAAINLTQFVSNVISLHIAKYTLFDFITDIRGIDSNVRSKENFGGSVTCVFCLFLCSFNLVIRFVICSIVNGGCKVTDIWQVQIFYNVFLMCLDILHVTQTLSNYYAYCAVIYLKHVIQNENSDINDIRKLFTYIADCCDKIRPLYRNLVSDF